MSAPLQILGQARFVRPVTATARADLGAELRARMPRPPRRLNSFIRLALIGALDALDGARPSPDTGVLIITHKTQADAAQSMIGQALFQPPVQPLAFINASPQMAGFYLAQVLGLCGPNLALAWTSQAMEQARILAGQNPRPWLIGQVDEVDADLVTHRQRRQMPTDAPLLERSQWEWLAPA